MSEQTSKQVAIRQLDMLQAIAALEIVVEKGVERGIPMDEEKLVINRLKTAFGITV